MLSLYSTSGNFRPLGGSGRTGVCRGSTALKMGEVVCKLCTCAKINQPPTSL
nr:MAG TPA: hypothetical protein [Caudoviricetes sp.]